MDCKRSTLYDALRENKNYNLYLNLHSGGIPVKGSPRAAYPLYADPRSSLTTASKETGYYSYEKVSNLFFRVPMNTFVFDLSRHNCLGLSTPAETLRDLETLSQPKWVLEKNELTKTGKLYCPGDVMFNASMSFDPNPDYDIYLVPQAISGINRSTTDRVIKNLLRSHNLLFNDKFKEIAAHLVKLSYVGYEVNPHLINLSYRGLQKNPKPHDRREYEQEGIPIEGDYLGIPRELLFSYLTSEINEKSDNPGSARVIILFTCSPLVRLHDHDVNDWTKEELNTILRAVKDLTKDGSDRFKSFVNWLKEKDGVAAPAADAADAAGQVFAPSSDRFNPDKLESGEYGPEVLNEFCGPDGRYCVSPCGRANHSFLGRLLRRPPTCKTTVGGPEVPCSECPTTTRPYYPGFLRPSKKRKRGGRRRRRTRKKVGRKRRARKKNGRRKSRKKLKTRYRDNCSLKVPNESSRR